MTVLVCPEGYHAGPPDLAVEVLSPGDRQGTIERKLAMWLETGTRSVWHVNPRHRTVEVISSTGREKNSSRSRRTRRRHCSRLSRKSLRDLRIGQRSLGPQPSHRHLRQRRWRTNSLQSPARTSAKRTLRLSRRHCARSLRHKITRNCRTLRRREFEISRSTRNQATRRRLQHRFSSRSSGDSQGHQSSGHRRDRARLARRSRNRAGQQTSASSLLKPQCRATLTQKRSPRWARKARSSNARARSLFR